MDALAVFRALDQELAKRRLQREIVICGGAALIALGVLSRETRDVDVLEPELDNAFLEAAKPVGKALGLHEGWLNNGPRDIAKELPKAWESRCTDVFKGSALQVRSIGRSDLICTKVYAAACRTDDIDDLVELTPTAAELKQAEAWTLKRDAADIWPRIVTECLAEVRRRMGNG
jgi:hypothetical protein